MGTIYNQALGFWRDGTGATATTFTTTLDQTPNVPLGVQSLLLSMSALSRCAFDGAAYQIAKPFAVGETAGDYPSVADRVVFLLKYAGSPQGSRIEIPAPKSDIFLPGARLVDMSNPDVEAFVAQVIAVAGDREGRPVAEVKQGRRQWVNRGPF